MQLILQLVEAGLLAGVFLASGIQLDLHIRNLSARGGLLAFQALDVRSNAADQFFGAGNLVADTGFSPHGFELLAAKLLDRTFFSSAGLGQIRKRSGPLLDIALHNMLLGINRRQVDALGLAFLVIPIEVFHRPLLLAR